MKMNPEANSATAQAAQEAAATPGSVAGDDAQKKINELQARVQELETQVKDKEQKHLYLYAEFENYKKRAIKERSDLVKYGWENQARELLQVVDNLERALQHTPEGTSKSLVDGLNMVLTQFRSTLQKGGVQALETQNQPFNPELHEAVGHMPSDKPEGTIAHEESKGYTLHGRLLRPSRVLVSNGKKTGNA